MTLLEVKDLNISYQTDAGIFPAVRNVSFSIEKGKSLGIIGESGCGKTTIGMGILQLLPENAKIESGSIIFKGNDLVTFSEEKLCDIRGADISMIFQAAMNSLNPVQRVGDQIVEAIQIHDHNISKNDAITDVKRLFMEVGLSPERLNDFPHQYSGGMKQRAIIAMSMACE
ncbi:MAG: ABC transporter ATP-binding protein, partial [Deltaproteobacteria bacterium]|nr:ABC transporter ATP-binding protein [Deltaproteobacteria bacterium]